MLVYDILYCIWTGLCIDVMIQIHVLGIIFCSKSKKDMYLSFSVARNSCAV